MNLEDIADREQAETKACEHCGAGVGETCKRRDGSEIENYPAHDARLRAAGVLHAPLDSRELVGNPKRRSEVHRAR